MGCNNLSAVGLSEAACEVSLQPCLSKLVSGRVEQLNAFNASPHVGDDDDLLVGSCVDQSLQGSRAMQSLWLTQRQLPVAPPATL